MSRPSGTRVARTVTWVCGEENFVAFSTSSANKLATSEAAYPSSVTPVSGGITLTRRYCSTMDTAWRSVVSSNTGRVPRRGVSPPNTPSLAASRRSRVTR